MFDDTVDTSASMDNSLLDPSWSANATLEELPQEEDHIKKILRSKCLRNCCPFGKGIFFKSRISPSPSKSRLRTRRLRRSSQPSENIDDEPATAADLSPNSTLLEIIQEPHIKINKKIEEKTTRLGLRKKLNYINQTNLLRTSMTGKEHDEIEKDKEESFIPAYQFFSESHTPEKLTSDYYSGSDTPSKLTESTRRLSIRKPYSSYIAYSSDEELEDWWQEPKTDYTYSVSQSYRERVTPDRKIGSPNMSRRGLRYSNVGTANSPPFRTLENLDNQTSTDSRKLDLRSRSIQKSNLDAFSDNSDVEESDIIRSRSRLDKNFVPINKDNTDSFQSLSRITSSRVEYGLDDSDSDDIHNNSLSHVAKPIVRKGRTSLMRSSTPLVSDPSDYASNYANSIGNTRIANHVSKTTIHTTISANGKRANAYRLNGQYDENKPVPSWKDKFTEWSYYSTTNIKKITSVIVTSVLLWTIKLTDKAKNIKSYCLKTNQSSSNIDLSFKNVKSDKNNVLSQSPSAASSKFVKTTVMSRTQTVFTTTEKLYEKYKEKRRTSPILWGWLPILLLLLLLFLPFCVFWLRQPSESLGTSATSYNRSWQSVIPSTVIRTITDFVNWSYVVFWSVASMIWNVITLLGSYISYCLIVVIDSVKLSLEWLWNWLCSIYGTVFNFWVTLFTRNEKLGTVKVNNENSWINLPSTFVSQVFKTTSSGLHLIWMSGEALVSHSTHFLSNLLFSLWNFGAWLILGLWSCIIFITSCIGTAFTSIFSYATVGFSSLLGAASNIFTVAPQSKIDLKITDKPIVNIASLPSNPSIQSHVSNDYLVAQLLKSPQLQLIISSVLDEDLNKKGISKEDMEYYVKSSVASGLKELRSDILLTGKSTDNQILQLKEQQAMLLLQLRNMETTLNQVKFSYEQTDEASKQTKSTLEGMITRVSADIEKLTKQFNDLQSNQESLKLEVRSCCKTTSLSLMDVEAHVNRLLTDIIGFNSAKRATGTTNFNEALDSSPFGAWLASYFVAKGEMENQLNKLMEEMKLKSDMKNKMDEAAHEESVKQTTQVVMDLVLKNIRSEIESQKEQILQHAKEAEEMSKSSQEMIQNFIAEEKNAVQSYKLQEETSENINLAVEQAFRNNLPNVAAQITLEVDAALQKQSNAMNSNLDISVEQKLNLSMNQIVKDQVAEILKEHLSSSVDNIKTTHTSVNIGSVSSDNSGAFRSSFESNSLGFNESWILQIVNKVLKKYDADKTGLVDHALESAGGTIVSTRCTEGYQGHQAELTIFGYPIYRYSMNTPRSIIQPDRMPGQCYAFKGSQGFIVIHFAGPVKVTAFSLEHIPKSLSPTQSIDSAPKDFSVFGLQTPNEEGFHLGNYVYRDNDEPLQYFPVTNYTEEYFKYVELKVNSNQGNLHYTCLYRFRVHGVRQF